MAHGPASETVGGGCAPETQRGPKRPRTSGARLPGPDTRAASGLCQVPEVAARQGTSLRLGGRRGAALGRSCPTRRARLRARSRPRPSSRARESGAAWVQISPRDWRRPRQPLARPAGRATEPLGLSTPGDRRVRWWLQWPESAPPLSPPRAPTPRFLLQDSRGDAGPASPTRPQAPAAAGMLPRSRLAARRARNRPAFAPGLGRLPPAPRPGLRGAAPIPGSARARAALIPLPWRSGFPDRRARTARPAPSRAPLRSPLLASPPNPAQDPLRGRPWSLRVRRGPGTQEGQQEAQRRGSEEPRQGASGGRQGCREVRGPWPAVTYPLRHWAWSWGAALWAAGPRSWGAPLVFPRLCPSLALPKPGLRRWAPAGRNRARGVALAPGDLPLGARALALTSRPGR